MYLSNIVNIIIAYIYTYRNVVAMRELCHFQMDDTKPLDRLDNGINIFSDK